MNASTNQPVGRALVQANGHSVLTGPNGKFEFSGFSGTTATVRVTKPGFYEGLDPYQTAARLVPIGSAVETQISLYPEALITGTLSAPDGDPLARISVQALRRIYDESGPRWILGGQANTNVDGEFRIPLPGGEYVLQTQYSHDRFGLRGAVLPIMVPGASGGVAGGISTIHLASGSEQHLELHPAVRPSHAVHIQIDSSGIPLTEQNAPQIQVHLANGMIFSPATRGAEKPGEVVVSLPNGSYMLSASTGGREDEAGYGETRISVADEDVAGATIHLQKAVELMIEVTADPSAATNASDPSSPSFVQQLGIFLQRTNAGISLGSQNVSPTSRRGAPAVFSLLPGSYQLRTTGYSAWFIESATAGGTDLLTRDFVVDAGGSSMPLRLVVNNQTATINGATRLGEQLTEAYIYLINTAPSALPVITAKSGDSGSFTRTLLPPGSYRAFASETRLNFDPADITMQKQVAPYMKTVTVGAGETGSVTLDMMPSTDLKP